MSCRVDNCIQEVAVKKHSLCRQHYNQFWGGRPFTDTPAELIVHKECKVVGCTKREISKGLCATCYGRVWAFGVSEEFLGELMSGNCDICGSTKNLTIDHDHSCCAVDKRGKTCGKCVRGIVCTRCNTALGCVKDSIPVLEEMVAYLTKRNQNPSM